MLEKRKRRRERYAVRDDVEQVKGIEPSCSAWEADILPLNYTCVGNSACLSYHSSRGIARGILPPEKIFRPERKKRGAPTRAPP